MLINWVGLDADLVRMAPGGERILEPVGAGQTRAVQGLPEREVDDDHSEETRDVLGVRATASQDTILNRIFIPDEVTVVVRPAGVRLGRSLPRRPDRWGAVGFLRHLPGGRQAGLRRGRRPAAEPPVAGADPVDGLPRDPALGRSTDVRPNGRPYLQLTARSAGLARRADDAAFVRSLGHPHVAGMTEPLVGRALDRPEVVIAVGLAMSSALDAAHRWGIPHGGVTPSAIGFDATGWPKLRDLGLAPACPLTTDVQDLGAVLADQLRDHPVPEPIARVVAAALQPRFADGFELGVALASAAAKAWGRGWLAASGVPVLATNIERWINQCADK